MNLRSFALSLSTVVALLAALPSFAAQTPFNGSPAPVPGLIQAEAFDRGGQGVAYYDTTPGNVFNVYRGTDVDVGPIPGGGYHIGFLGTGEWVEYTISVPSSGTYNFDFRVASDYTGANVFRVFVDGLQSGSAQGVSYTGGWHNYVMLSVPVHLNAGTRVLRIAFDRGHWNLDWMNVSGQSPYGSSPIVFPGRLEAERYDRGGEGLAYHDTTPGNVFNTFRSDGMDVGRIPGAGYHLGYIDRGEWAEYTIRVLHSGNYELRLRLATAYTGTSRFRVLINGHDVSGSQTFTNTGGWHNYQTRVIPVTLSAGTNQILRLSFETGAWNLDYIDAVRVTCSTPVITQQPVSRSVNVGGTASFTARATGSPAPALQWLKNNAVIPGATGTTLTLNNVGTSDAGSYRLRASNSCGLAYSSVASLTVTVPSCSGSPGRMQEALADVLNGDPAGCNWLAEHRPSFPDSMGGGSYNKPVLAAAIALVTEPVRSGSGGWNMYNWWDLYLRGELGMRGNVWYYGGKEPTSAVYQHYNIASVMTVHHIAKQRGRTGLRDLARQWLQATWAVHSMAAVPSKPLSFHDRGREDPFISGYAGPFIPIAGMRSSENYWGGVNRSILFAEAVGAGSNRKRESLHQTALRTTLERLWSSSGYSYSLYGLNSSQRTALTRVMNQGVLSGTVTSMLGGIRTIVPMHFVGWPGVRVTLLERNGNGNTAPTYGTAYFAARRDSAGREVHYLYPWKRSAGAGDRPFRHGITEGSASLNLAQRRMEATNAPAQDPHPVSTAVITDLPAGPPQFSYTLRP